MKSTGDYTGRQIDMEILRTVVSPDGTQAVALSIAGRPSKAVAGIQKLSQRFVLAFLTTLGESKFQPEFGTSFLVQMRGGGMTNYGRFKEVFALANIRAISALRADSNGLPDDEVLVTSTLLDFNLDTQLATIQLQVQLTNLAGDSAVFVIPTSTVPL